MKLNYNDVVYNFRSKAFDYNLPSTSRARLYWCLLVYVTCGKKIFHNLWGLFYKNDICILLWTKIWSVYNFQTVSEPCWRKSGHQIRVLTSDRGRVQLYKFGRFYEVEYNSNEFGKFYEDRNLDRQLMARYTPQ